ncbi:hypothetical protein MDAP_001705 [Mitosporidium daphniae]
MSNSSPPPQPHSGAPVYAPGITFNKPMSVVFIGSIPYDTTEEQLMSLFSTVGPVRSLRLVFDRETGKSKGYGFCEYHDTETARSCVRNLSNYELNGRNLRLDFADSMLGAPKELRKENKAARIYRPNSDYGEGSQGPSSSFWDPFSASGSGGPPPPPHLSQPVMMPMMVPGSGQMDNGQQWQGIPPPPPPTSIPYFQQSFIPQAGPASHMMGHAAPHGIFPQQNVPPSFPMHSGAAIQYPVNGPISSFPPPPPNFQGGQYQEMHHQQQMFGSQQPQHVQFELAQQLPPPPPPPPAASMTALESLPPDQLFSLLAHIKNLTQSQPSQAKDLLGSNPHLTYALFHILWRMDLIDAQTIQRTISALSVGPPEASGANTVELRSQDPRKLQASDPLKSDQQQALLEQIRRMTPEQLEALPPEQREKILLLKNKV